ncbi:helix-turn-helix domain-containing protein [Nocardia sp. GTS18]|uniref:MmyB family transcriptional regulator n=1 Tax=Nocardia sp. GTS18 TaxID=1778064 RepID=UPI003519EEFD
MTTASAPAGTLLRQWRTRRRRSQLDVALAADISTRHLSFLETGRAVPSRTMITRLCDELEVPLRDRNTLFLAAGLAPEYPEHPLDDLGTARHAIQAVLAGHDPNPAVAVNARWEVLAANRAMSAMLSAVPTTLTGPPLNMLRATLHPEGLAPQLRDPARWRDNALRRARRQYERTADPQLATLITEIESYPIAATADTNPDPLDDLVIPMRLTTDLGELSLIYAVTVFGSPRDITMDELAIETFFPADEATRALLPRLVDPCPSATTRD